MKVFTKNLYQKNKGFTLIELLVVMAIFIVITSVVLFNQNKFSSDTALTSLTYEIALQIRQAQVYGILVRQQTSAFDVGYGIHFQNNNGVISFLLFSDLNNDGKYVLGDDGNPISTFSLREGNTISNVCTTKSGVQTCFSDLATLLPVDVVFRRPNPDASIIDSFNISNNQVDITITSALKDRSKTITVLNTGQISLK